MSLPASFSNIALGTQNAAGDYVVNSPNFTPTAVGRYQWIASYTGDANNAASTTACKDTGEASVVTQPVSTISTAQSFILQDTATLGTAGDSGTYDGSLLFQLYEGQSCSGSVKYEQTIDVPASTAPGTSFTTNPGGNNPPNAYTINAGNATNGISWKVTYSGDSVRSGVVSNCVEKSTLSITNS